MNPAANDFSITNNVDDNNDDLTYREMGVMFLLFPAETKEENMLTRVFQILTDFCILPCREN